MFRWFLQVLLSLSITASVCSRSFAQMYTTDSGVAEFTSTAPLSEFTGTSSNLNGLVDLNQNLLDFYLDLITLKTGIGLRDRHMRENYLETKKYPFVEFSGTLDARPELVPGSKQAVTATGHFTLHGIRNELTVSGYLTLEESGDLLLEAGFRVMLGDFNIAIPKVVFYELAEEQQVRISAVLKPQSNE